MEGWDEIGGHMVWSRKRLATAGKPHGTATKTVNPGKALLNAEADKTVGEERTKIIKALLNSLIECKNMTSAKLLFDLADGLIDCENPEVMNELCSYAESLTAEQQVPAEMADAAETVKKEGEAELAK